MKDSNHIKQVNLLFFMKNNETSKLLSIILKIINSTNKYLFIETEIKSISWWTISLMNASIIYLWTSTSVNKQRLFIFEKKKEAESKCVRKKNKDEINHWKKTHNNNLLLITITHGSTQAWVISMVICNSKKKT